MWEVKDGEGNMECVERVDMMGEKLWERGWGGDIDMRGDGGDL